MREGELQGGDGLAALESPDTVLRQNPLLCENSGAVATEAGWSTTGGHETSTWDGVAIPVPGQA